VEEEIGRRTRRIPDQTVLAQWRKQLVQRYPRIRAFFTGLRECFNLPRVRGYDSYLEFQPQAYRQRVDKIIGGNLASLSAALAVTLREFSLIARFSSWCLCERSLSGGDEEKAEKALAEIFPGARISLQFSERKTS
jgi:hypothetical protein